MTKSTAINTLKNSGISSPISLETKGRNTSYGCSFRNTKDGGVRCKAFNL